MPFEKGVSGNPKGRPKKERTLSAILERAGNVKISSGDDSVARKHVLADMLWSAATTKKINLSDGSVTEIAADDWLAVAKFIYTQIDGPPKQVNEHTGKNGDPIEHKHTSSVTFYIPSNGRDEGNKTTT